MLFKEQRQRWFANYMTSLSLLYNKATHEEKEILFQNLKKQKSKIPKFQKTDSIRIVEFGAGSGCNLRYFPEKCNLLVVDPNPYFEDHFRKELQKYPGITLEGYITAYGEDTSEYIPNASVDAVVVTAVGCSVNNIQQIYKEIQRILVPGGKYYYLEHILGQPGTWPYYKQKIMAAFKVWPMINCNCHIDRDLDYQITLAGFSNIDQRLFEMDTKPYLGFHFISPHVTGIATK